MSFIRHLSLNSISLVIQLQLSLPITLLFGLAKNRWYSETAALGGIITLKNLIWDLNWAAVLGGRRYWKGGGIGREDCIALQYPGKVWLAVVVQVPSN